MKSDFGKADKDNNGTLDKSEGNAMPGVAKISTRSIPTRMER